MAAINVYCKQVTHFFGKGLVLRLFLEIRIKGFFVTKLHTVFTGKSARTILSICDNDAILKVDLKQNMCLFWQVGDRMLQPVLCL